MLPNGSTLPIEFVIDTGFTGDIAILAGVVNFLPHPSPPLTKVREQEIHK
jgi:predicted aspartyl protease